MGPLSARVAARARLLAELPPAKLERLARKLGRVLKSLESDTSTNRPGPKRVSLWALDARIARLFEAWPNYISTAPGVAYAYLDDYRRTQKRLYHTADTLEQLAQKIGLPKDALVRSVAAYNAEIADELVEEIH